MQYNTAVYYGKFTQGSPLRFDASCVNNLAIESLLEYLYSLAHSLTHSPWTNVLGILVGTVSGTVSGRGWGTEGTSAQPDLLVGVHVLLLGGMTQDGPSGLKNPGLSVTL